MGKFTARRQIRDVKIKGKTRRIRILDTEKFDSFNPQILDLGDISLPSKDVDAIAAVFDLSGFTRFCNQSDPHLAVPEYLSRFLDWLFSQLKQEVVQKKYREGRKLWTDLPFLAKFLGDGVLFLWDTNGMQEASIGNVVVTLRRICLKYVSEFYPKIKSAVSDAPTNLRCGIARGRVYSVGNRQDYVGPCINIASRLQKVSHLTFCFTRKGFDIDKYMHKTTRQVYIEKRIDIRGIGENELVWLVKGEFDSLSEEEKTFFREP